MTAKRDVSFSDDISAHVNEALTHLLTLDLATVTVVNTTRKRVQIELQVKNVATNSITKVPMFDLPYLCHPIHVTDSAGKTATVDSWTPKKGDKVLVAYIEKSFSRVVVIGRLG
jgi:hypothetical protein